MSKPIIEYIWEDSTCEFKCPKCGAELYGDSQSEPGECECGLKYIFRSFIEILNDEARNS